MASDQPPFDLRLAGVPPYQPPLIPLLVRPAAHFLTPSPLDNLSNNSVAFYHPGYSSYRNKAVPSADDYVAVKDLAAEMFRMAAYDSGGLHYGTALAACLIIACNKPGYLTTNTPGGDRVQASWDDVLPAGVRYYYHLAEDTDTPYPVCPTFADWRFDPRVIPTQWVSAFDLHTTTNPIVSPSQMSPGIHTRDSTCRITSSRDSTKTAHIIPRTELDWFMQNAMHIYNSTVQSSTDHIDDVRNGFLLRRDLHQAFERQVFCLAVKEGRVVSHFLERTYEMGVLYHNCVFRIPEADPSVEFVWARFAWSILRFVSGFAVVQGRAVRLADGRVCCVGALERGGEDEENPRPPKKRKRRQGPRGDFQGGGGGGGGVNTVPKGSGTQEQGKALGVAAPTGLSHAYSWGDISPSLGLSKPGDISPRQTDVELAEDINTKDRFFPLMSMTHCPPHPSHVNSGR